MVPASGETNTKSSTESLNTELINFISANKVDYGTDDTLPTIIYKDAIDTIQKSNDIIYNNILIRRMFLLPQGEYVEVVHAQFKVRDAQFYQEQEMLLVSPGEGQATDGMTYYAILKRLDTQL